VNNLSSEGITQGVHLVGDVMYDAIIYNATLAESRSSVLERLHLRSGGYALATVHRPHNTDDPDRLGSILEAFSEIPLPVVFPVHPRTRQRLAKFGLSPPLFNIHHASDSVNLIDPVGYLDMLVLERNAHLILTDSGGVQKEAYFFAVPCLTLREETEWVETVDAGWNQLVGADQEAIVQAAARGFRPAGPPPPLFGDGRAAEKIAVLLTEHVPR
jgi:UDP-N-acetylglucosamine 2-epimerase